MYGFGSTSLDNPNPNANLHMQGRKLRHQPLPSSESGRGTIELLVSLA